MESLCTTFVDVHNVFCIQTFQKSQRAEKLYVAVLPIIGKEQHKSNTDIAYIYCNYGNVLPESLRNKKASSYHRPYAEQKIQAEIKAKPNVASELS